MAKYDPKRPRTTAVIDEPEQIDALLGAADAPTDTESLDAAAPGTDATTPAGGVPDAQPILDKSQVPVVPPPVEGTTNRAVLGAVAATALALLIGWLILRRRRPD